MVGSALDGVDDGSFDGDRVGIDAEGEYEGTEVGAVVGRAEGIFDGGRVGLGEGRFVGSELVGPFEGVFDGALEGIEDGKLDVGPIDGKNEGADVTGFFDG